MDVHGSEQRQDVVLLVDIADVMGSRPDGWWNDRAAAGIRLLQALEPLINVEVGLPDRLGIVHICEVHAVVKGETNAPRDRQPCQYCLPSLTATARSCTRRVG
jgi:hypothetical protein